MEKSVFTIAMGKNIYIEMAFALARSFLLHNKDNGIGFTLITDRPISERPADLRSIEWKEIDAAVFGQGFSSKLHLDKLAPAKCSMFVDADCICFDSLLPAFEAFAGRDVSVIGKRISTGEWFGDVPGICRTLGLGGLPRFNGGVYYLEPGKVADAVFKSAREIEARYDEVGFERLRGYANDEVCMAVAMEQHGQEALADTGTIMNTTHAASRHLEVDVLSGNRLLCHDTEAPDRDPFFELPEMRPALVHFVGQGTTEHPFGTQVLLLKLTCARGWPVFAARGWAAIRMVAPWKLKNALRPYYRALFGVRRMRPSARQINEGV